MSKLAGGHLKAWRKHRGLTQAQLAARIATSKGCIASLEASTRTMSVRWLVKLASVLETTPGTLLDRDPADVDLLSLWAQIAPADRRRAAAMIALFADQAASSVSSAPR